MKTSSLDQLLTELDQKLGQRLEEIEQEVPAAVCRADPVRHPAFAQ
jgi:hypothetical protein